MAEWEEEPDLAGFAAQVIAKRPEVAHVEVESILFLRELETRPKALTRTYRLKDHPIGFFTDKVLGYRGLLDQLRLHRLTG